MQPKNLADKITTFFSSRNMLGGASVEEMYTTTYKALSTYNYADIETIVNYFKDLKKYSKVAEEIYYDLVIDYLEKK